MFIPNNARHSPDFACVHVNGCEFSFTPTQAAIVRLLWEAAANATPEVRACTLILEAGSAMKENRLGPLFFRNPAWKTLIVPGSRRGTYRLAFRPNHRAVG